MFTGLVETMGVLARVTERGPSATLEVRASFAGEPLALGESIAIDGACLSVVEVTAAGFLVDATAETLARTTLGGLGGSTVGGRVNLERSLRAGDRLGGHLVTGHIDAVGSLLERRSVGDAVAMSFALPATLARFVAEKGSIAVSGVSLTVNGVRDLDTAAEAHAFDVMLIPITLRETTLGALEPGARVNLEVDLVARYVARCVGSKP